MMMPGFRPIRIEAAGDFQADFLEKFSLNQRLKNFGDV